jgi:hypothetical protein
MAEVYDKEKTLFREIAPQVENAIGGVEVLALELSGPERFTVFIDHPQGVDHELCARVTDVLRSYLRDYTVEVSSPGVERPLISSGRSGSRCRSARRRTSRDANASRERSSAPARWEFGSRPAPTSTRFRTRRSCGET